MNRPVHACVLLTLGAACSASGGDSTTSGAFHARGFRVQTGAATAFTVEDCQQLERCFGNNVDTPYLLFSVPPHPDHPGQLPPDQVGPVPGVPEGMSAAYHLEPGEVIFVRGEAPPASAYYGFSPYLFTRVDEEGTRVMPFASLTDTVNHVVIERSGRPAFGSEIAVLMSSDLDAMSAAREALEEEGTDPDAIFSLPIRRDGMRYGHGTDADTFLLLGRIALVDDPDAEAAYIGNPPLEVLRLTPDQTGRGAGLPERAARGDGRTEDHLQPALDALEAALLAHVADAATEVVDITGSGLIAQVIEPESCIAASSECLGDNSDTTYAVGPIAVARGDGELTLGANDALWVYGVNHAAVGKAIYNSVGVYTKSGRTGVLSFDSARMPGTAEAFLPDHPDAAALWVQQIRRDCTGQDHCIELATGFPGVPLDESLFLIFRSYVNPGLTVSPDHGEILTEKALLVRG